MNPDVDIVKELGALIAEAGGRVTFSKWCRSGLVPDCICWRCSGVDPGDEDPRAEARAREIDARRIRSGSNP